MADAITPEQWRNFFKALALSGNVSAACEAGKISRMTAYRYKNTDRFIAERWQEAIDVAGDKLEDAAWTRAVEGVIVCEEPIMYYGKEVGRKITRKYSDGLLNTLLAANRPEKFRPVVNVHVNWRAELEAAGFDPQELFNQLVAQAEQRLLAANDEVIELDATDITASIRSDGA